MDYQKIDKRLNFHSINQKSMESLAYQMLENVAVTITSAYDHKLRTKNCWFFSRNRCPKLHGSQVL